MSASEVPRVFTLCCVHKNGMATIEYADDTIFVLSAKEVSEIVPYKEPVKHVRYFNIYADHVSGGGHQSRRRANDVADSFRIGCKRVEFTEGEFDD